jgi:hypothetical protein
MDSRRKRALTISVLVTVAAAITAVAAMWSLACYQETHFESLSARISALRPGESTLAECSDAS